MSITCDSPEKAFVLDSPRAAEYLSVTEQYLRRLRHEGKGPRYAKLGRRAVYRVEDLEAYVNDRLVSTAGGRR